MICRQRIEHVIRKGDTLYELAKYYKTSLPELFALNPSINPYNLQVGSKINVCPGEGFEEKGRSREELREEMRLVWLQHVYWTRMLLISIAERLGDKDAVEKRLLENPEDIADIFAKFYPKNMTSRLAQVITEHLGIGEALIIALQDNDMEEANALNDQWYVNANQMAALFAQMNPYYEERKIREMLYQHLKLTKEEVAARLQGNYPSDIQAFSRVEAEALNMAGEFAEGIIEQFPESLM